MNLDFLAKSLLNKVMLHQVCRVVGRCQILEGLKRELTSSIRTVLQYSKIGSVENWLN